MGMVSNTYFAREDRERLPSKIVVLTMRNLPFLRYRMRQHPQACSKEDGQYGVRVVENVEGLREAKVHFARRCEVEKRNKHRL